MNLISKDLINKLRQKKINTFFGVQGGACARLIEDVVKSGGKYYPVLNEQAAGYAAHGYYLATKKVAGIILTTGPGFTNAVSGIAACYYDNIPLVVLVGQVSKSLNKAKKFKTKMVGFQEIQHLKIGESISDEVFCIDSVNNYKRFVKQHLNSITKKVSIIEVLDDVQRMKINNISQKKDEIIKLKKITFNRKDILELNSKEKLLFILGAGFSRNLNVKSNLNLLNTFKIPSVLTWGAQEITRRVKISQGIFGEHTPGKGNQQIEKSDIIICLGGSLLQHQVGKSHKNFAPNAKILFVNNDYNECRRAKKQFGKRLTFYNCEINDFLKSFYKIYKTKKLNQNTIDYKKKPLPKKIDKTPVPILAKIFNKINPNSSIIFSDAGATLSWSYQASNILGKKSCPLFTSFNLHAMGYANCAGFGAATETKKNIFVVIGDGSIPMNSQELAWASRFRIKFIVIDNQGYGIIRQTQRQFYKSLFVGSDFKNKKSSLPSFSIKKIFESFDIPAIQLNLLKIDNDKINFFLKQKKSTALIIRIDYSAEVKTK